MRNILKFRYIIFQNYINLKNIFYILFRKNNIIKIF